MMIRFLGNWSSNIVKSKRNISFTIDGKIVFDFGPHTIESLLDLNLDPCNIEKVLITHMHLDHYSGISELLWYRSIHKAEKRLFILGPRGIKRNTELLMRVLKTPKPWYKEQIDTNTTYIEDKGVDSIEVFHGRHLVPDNGYRIDYKGKTIFYSGDTAYSKDIVKGASNADYLIHEMTYTDDDEKFARYWKHSTYSTAMKVFEESGAKKLVPVHLSTKSNLLALKLSKERKDIIYPEKSIKL